MNKMPIYMRVLFSAIASLFSLFVVLALLGGIFQNLFQNSDTSVLEWVGAGLTTFGFALFFAGPFIAIAMVISVVFRKSIDKHLLVWSCIAPFIVWLFVTIAIFLHHYFPSYQTFVDGQLVKPEFLESLMRAIKSRETFISLEAAALAAFIFYFVSNRSGLLKSRELGSGPYIINLSKDEKE